MNSRKFRNALGHFATGVTVITSKVNDRLVGLTANAFSSLSLDPPLILVCIDKSSSSMEAFQMDQPFAVNILRTDQEEDCWRFSQKTADKFKGCSYTLSNDGIPIIEGNLATIHCTVHSILEGGDHYIVTGRVKDVFYDEQGEPLLFFRGEMGQLQPKEKETTK